ncbi:MAG: bifunctional [glutamate--ammonia ligase]-adenylyl-L-tyrosine phosphorylase/[glutamate--ammonia-ligase] adenylyltransferase [Planctomycetales bacterium]|nr:bifunctional [glutamate--ammonia ligase]-adenylyl-L-tyrosine phosphorylase/[glutamate--ammonia-ligase] adenylyltransferase [Planctomycetales bacterium]
MEIETLVGYLDHPPQAESWLRQLGLRDLARSQEIFKRLASSGQPGLPLDLLAHLCGQLEELLPSLSDADLALNNLERFIAAARSPLSLVSLFQREPDALRTLLQIISTSQYLADLLIRDPEGLDLLRMTEGQPVARQLLLDEICAEAEALEDPQQLKRLLRRYKQRETLRIAYGDIVRQQPVQVVTRQISYLADAILEAAIRFARRRLEADRGPATVGKGEPARFCALALGKLGGEELNYSSDIDLIFLGDSGARTNGPRAISGDDFFSRLAKEVVRLLTESTEHGAAYRVDLRLRPHGDQGPLVMSFDAAQRYYDVSGRTWERQAFVKARTCAGDKAAGDEFIARLQPWIYQRYLSRADISGIKALKRKIERRAEQAYVRDLKTGHGGIRDIEFVIQFLQLLNGGDLPGLRTGNTLEAIRELESAGCLTMQERTLLEENYAMLRKVEHRLQIMFDLQTHRLPSSPGETSRLAKRMGFRDVGGRTALELFDEELQRRTTVNRQILDHLLHDAFVDDESADPIMDLVLDPAPEPARIETLLSRFGFRDVPEAYRRLLELSEERIPFLSTRRCRHFLAAIAPRLLEAVGTTPDPDGALLRLSLVSDSLGGKGVLWELFSYSPPTLQLYVRLCAAGDYLTGILTAQPGMIDELMDSLVLDRLPELTTLQRQLEDVCRGAADLDPILLSFKSLQHLRVGVRDVLGKNDVQHSHAALSDVAEVILERATRHELAKLVEKHGEPMLANSTRPCEFMILALGKLGGREPNYHSDLDIIFLYEGNGQTQPRGRGQRETTNQHFFSQLGQRIIKRMTQLGATGRLYEVDSRLRPNGASGALAVSLHNFQSYFENTAELWERQALCKARVVFGTDAGRERTMHAVRMAQFNQPWRPGDSREILEMRSRTEDGAGEHNLKRAPGGTMDVEFFTQRLQLEYGQQHPEILSPNTLEALQQLDDASLLPHDDAEALADAYRFLRKVEARLRLLNTAKRHDLPADELDMNKLAYLLDLPGGAAELASACNRRMRDVRKRFLRLMGH